MFLAGVKPHRFPQNVIRTTLRVPKHPKSETIEDFTGKCAKNRFDDLWGAVGVGGSGFGG